jgi:hypothetical protein
MFGDASEIIVDRQHRQLVTYAQLRQQCIDRSDLHATSAATVSQLSRADVIVAIGREQGDSGKPIQDEIAIFRARKSLQKLLKNESGR